MCSGPIHRATAPAHGAVAALLALPALATVPFLSALASPGVGPALGRVAVTLLLAAATVPTSAGRTSPDIDQIEAWSRLDRLVPDEWLGFGGPLRHRGISHWWGIPALLTVAAVAACRALPSPVAVLVVVPVAWLVLGGWWSHLLSDYAIGGGYEGGRRPDDRLSGIGGGLIEVGLHGLRKVDAGNLSAPGRAAGWGRRGKKWLDADDAPRGPGIPVFPWWGHVGWGKRIGTGWEVGYLQASEAAGVGALVAAWFGTFMSPLGQAGLTTGLLVVGVPVLAAMGVSGRRRYGRWMHRLGKR